MRVHIYTRHSTEHQEKSEENQRHLCEEWCRTHEYLIADYYHEGAVSGGLADVPRLKKEQGGITYSTRAYLATLEKRPELRRMLGALKKGDLVLVWKMDRFAREDTQMLQGCILLDILNSGADYRSVEGEGTDLQGIARTMSTAVLGAVASVERQNTRKRVKDSLGAMKARGERVSRFLPFGWMLDEGGPKRLPKNPPILGRDPDGHLIYGPHVPVPYKVVPCPKEQGILKMMKSWEEEGARPGEIQKRLFERGVPTRRGREKWQIVEIQTTLRNARVSEEP